MVRYRICIYPANIKETGNQANPARRTGLNSKGLVCNSPAWEVVETVSVSFAVPLAGMLFVVGLKLQVTDEVGELHEKVAEPVYPLTEATATVKSADDPALIVALLEDIEGLKSQICSWAVVLWLTESLVPVTKKV